MEGRTDNFTPRGYLHPYGPKFTPGEQLRPWGSSSPLGAKLRMGLSDRCAKTVTIFFRKLVKIAKNWDHIITLTPEAGFGVD
jgi:hypothetical protein